MSCTSKQSTRSRAHCTERNTASAVRTSSTGINCVLSSEPAENAAVTIADRMQLSTSSSAKRMKNALKNCMATSAKQKIKAVENPPL